MLNCGCVVLMMYFHLKVIWIISVDKLVHFRGNSVHQSLFLLTRAIIFHLLTLWLCIGKLDTSCNLPVSPKPIITTCPYLAFSMRSLSMVNPTTKQSTGWSFIRRVFSVPISNSTILTPKHRYFLWFLAGLRYDRVLVSQKQRPLRCSKAPTFLTSCMWP